MVLSFFLGKYFGENRFDKEKIDLLFENKNLIEKNDSIRKKIELKKNRIYKCRGNKKNNFAQQPFLCKATISY